MMRFLIAALALAHLGASWPTNVVLVTDSATNAECTAANTPHDCCTGSGTGACNGLESDDIKEGLATCEAAGGCHLKLSCGIYSSPEIDVGGGQIDGRSYAQAADDAYPNGLVIDGQGCAILQSSIPPPSHPGGLTNARASIFWFQNWDPTGTPVRGLSRLKLQNFECDGRSSLQSAPNVDCVLCRLQTCILSRSTGVPSDDATVPDLQLFEVENIYAHNLIGDGIAIGDAAQTYVHHNTISDTGCQNDWNNAQCDAGPGPNLECTGAGVPNACCTGSGLGNCTPHLCCTGAGTGTCETFGQGGWINGGPANGEIECGCGAGDPGDCRGWNLEPNVGTVAAGQVGRKEDAFGINLGGNGRHLASNNKVTRSTKYGIVGAHSGDPTQHRASDMVRIHANTTDRGLLMAGTHAQWVWISSNTVLNMGMEGQHVNEAVSIHCSGLVDRYWVIGNTVPDSKAQAIDIQCYPGKPNIARHTRIEANTISGVCDWVPIQNQITNGAIMMEIGGTLVTCDETPNFNRSLEIVGNTVDVQACGRALNIHETDPINCPGEIESSTLITGGSFRNPTWAGQIENLAHIHATAINATGVTLNQTGGTSPDWFWDSGSTGTCSGFTKNGSTTVIDNSGNSIGTCP